MSEKKIAFIICSNKEPELAEVLFYIEGLNIPEGFEYEVLVINNAAGMAAGYQYAMSQSDAKYKIYLHEDVFIINKNAVCEVIEQFEAHPDYRMLGVFGVLSLSADGTMPMDKCNETQVGHIIGNIGDRMEDRRVWPGPLKEYSIVPVAALDGLFMVTSVDLPWRGDIFDGWHYYDVSQSMEFNKRGLKVGCINTKEPWLIHRSDRQTTGLSFEKYRVLFLREYADVLQMLS